MKHHVTDHRFAGGRRLSLLLGLLGLVAALLAISLYGSDPDREGAPARALDPEGPGPRPSPENPGMENRDESAEPAPAPDPEDVAEIEGIVFDPDGSRAGADIPVTVLHRIGDGEIATSCTRADGGFTIRVPRGLAGGETGFRISARDEKRGLLSVPYVLGTEEIRAPGLVILRLVVAGRLRVQLVDAGGRPVSGGCLLVRGRATGALPAHLAAHFTRWTRVFAADAAGEVDAPLPPILVKLWAKGPGGSYGSSIKGRVTAGRTTDLGTIEVGGDLSLVTLHLRDEAGDPVSAALLRVEFEHACHVADETGDFGGMFQYRSDERGDVTLRFGRSREPVLVGIGAPGFRVVSATIDRSLPCSEHVVVLRKNPGATVILVQPDGRPPPADLEVTTTVSPFVGISTESGSWEEVLLGVPNPMKQPVRDQAHPAWLVAIATVGEALWTGESPGVYHVATPEPGHLTVHLSVALGVELHVPVEASPDWPTKTVRLPEGRAVRIEMVEAPPSPGRRALLGAERGRVWLFPLVGDEGAASMPRSPGEMLELGRTGIPAPTASSDGGASRVVWLEEPYGRIRALFPFKRLAASLTQAWGEEFSDFLLRTDRFKSPSDPVPVPRSSGAEVRLQWPTVDLALPLRKIRARVVLDGKPFEASGLRVVVRQERPDGQAGMILQNAGALLEYTQSTDEHGVATFFLPAGEFFARLHPQDSASERTGFRVEGTPVEVEVRLREQ